jgi:hypothetical protein
MERQLLGLLGFVLASVQVFAQGALWGTQFLVSFGTIAADVHADSLYVYVVSSNPTTCRVIRDTALGSLQLSKRRAKALARLLSYPAAKVVGIGPDTINYDNDLPEGRFHARTVKIEVEHPRPSRAYLDKQH